jgi:hypothetical protein
VRAARRGARTQTSWSPSTRPASPDHPPAGMRGRHGRPGGLRALRRLRGRDVKGWAFGRPTAAGRTAWIGRGGAGQTGRSLPTAGAGPARLTAVTAAPHRTPQRRTPRRLAARTTARPAGPPALLVCGARRRCRGGDICSGMLGSEGQLAANWSTGQLVNKVGIRRRFEFNHPRRRAASQPAPEWGLGFGGHNTIIQCFKFGVRHPAAADCPDFKFRLII